MRAACAGDSTSRMNSIAARRRPGSRANTTQTQPPVPVECVPASAVGIGATSHFAKSAEDRTRRRAALNRVAEEREQAQHRAPVRLLAEDRPAVAIHELATLRPEHREVVEHGGFPAAGVVQIARHFLLTRTPARGLE